MSTSRESSFRSSWRFKYAEHNCHFQPSVQSLITSVHYDFCNRCISEESLRTPSPIENHEQLFSSLRALCDQLTSKVDEHLLSIAKEKSEAQAARNKVTYEKILSNIVGISRRPTTHVSFSFIMSCKLAAQVFIVALSSHGHPVSSVSFRPKDSC